MREESPPQTRDRIKRLLRWMVVVGLLQLGTLAYLWATDDRVPLLVVATSGLALFFWEAWRIDKLDS